MNLAIKTARTDEPNASSFKLLLTSHFVRSGRVGGAEHMLYNLVQGLIANKTDTTLLCGDQSLLSSRFRSLLNQAPFISVLERGGGGNRFVAEQRACLSVGLSSDAILFPNYYLPPVVPRRLGRTGVVIHDFQYRHFPQYFSTKKRAWLRASQAWAMRKADRVIVISEFVRQDAIRLYGNHVAERLAVVPNALCWNRFSEGLNRPRLCEQPYILSVAAQYPHKNLETLIKAFALIVPSNPDLKLVLCGQSYNSLHGVMGARGGVGPLIAAHGLEDKIELTGYVDDPTLAQWYSHAEMFVFPSVFEGFGMPPVEALSFGLPTVVTRATSLPETTLGLAEMIDDPLNESEWAERMLMILKSPSQYRPAAAAVSHLKAFYDPARLAKAYISALAT